MTGLVRLAGFFLAAGLWAGAAGDLASRVDALVARLGAPGFNERQAAYEGLFALGADHPEEVLARLPFEHHDPETRAACERLRKKIPVAGFLKEAVAEAAGNDVLTESVSDLLGDPSRERATAFARTWSDRKEGVASRILVHFLASDDGFLRAEAAQVLARWEARGRVPEVRPLTTHKDPGVRRIAAFVLGRLGDAAALPDLLPLLSDEDVDVRGAAAESAGLLGEAKAIPGLARLLDDTGEMHPLFGGPAVPTFRGSRLVQTAAAEALARLKDPSLVPLFVERLTDPDLNVRALSVEALGRLGDATTVPCILKLVDDRQALVRIAAVQALGNLKERSTVPFLAALLDAEAKDVNLPTQAAMALQKILGAPWPNTGRIEAARAWWEASKDDPAFAPGASR